MKIKIGLLTMSLVMIMGQVAYLTSDDIRLDDARSAGEILYEYGVISGMGNGDLNLEGPLTRAEACVLLAELNGAKREAMQSAYIFYFDDVESTSWYAPYVVYAKTMGWISGYPDGLFRPEAHISSKEWASMLMNILGYPFTWENIENDVAALGINYLAVAQDDFRRNEAFDLLWQALNVPPKGDTEILGVRLGYMAPLELDAEEIAIIGYITPSLRTISIKFDTPLSHESATDLTHYNLTDMSGQPVNIVQITCSDEGDEVKLILDAPRATYDRLKLVMTHLTLTSGKEVSQLSIEPIEMIDIINPDVVSIYRLDDEEQVHIVFSEPMIPLKIDDLYVDATKGQIQTVEMLNANQEALVTFSTVPTALATITLKNTISDDYGHQIVTKAYPVVIKTSEIENQETPTEAPIGDESRAKETEETEGLEKPKDPLTDDLKEDTPDIGSTDLAD